MVVASFTVGGSFDCEISAIPNKGLSVAMVVAVHIPLGANANKALAELYCAIGELPP